MIILHLERRGCSQISINKAEMRRSRLSETVNCSLQHFMCFWTASQVLRVSPSPSSQFLPTHFSTPVTCLEAGDFKAGTERPARTWVLVDEKDNSHLGISVWWVRVTAYILHIRPLFLDITTKRAAGIGPSVAVFPFCSDF